MTREVKSLVRRLRTDENGAVAALAAISIVALIGLTGLALDIGNMVYAQRRLQATTDMAAFAGAQFIVAGKAIATANQYSAVNGVGNNTINGLTVAMASGYPQLICDPNITNLVSCAGPPAQCASGCNTIEVKQTATVPLIFAKWFGITSTQLSATSFAARGGGFPPMHIMIVLDNTESMNSTDSSPGGATCGGITNATRIECALAGIQTLLAELWPTQDQVGLMVFPPVQTSTASNDATCTSATISPEPYSASIPSTATYQIASLANDYKSSNTATSLTAPNTTSNLVNATCHSGLSIDQNGVSSTCHSCSGDKVVGGEGTYLAGAITAAQAALAANALPGVQNVIIVLSDGGAGNAANLWSSTTAQAAAPGTTILTMASTVPADVIPGTSVADNTAPCPTGTSNCAIPAGTQVLSTSGSTVTLTAAVTAAATGTTSASTPPGNATLHFAAVPAAVTTGMAVSDQTNSSAIAACTTVVSETATTVTLSNAVTGTTTVTDITNAATPPAPASNDNILYFASVPATIKVGMGVTDTTHPSAIPSGTTVVSFTATTVTLSSAVVPVPDSTTAQTKKGNTTLTFASVPASVTPGATVTGAGIASGTTVSKVTATTVTISKGTTATINIGEGITFSGDSVAIGDTITFSTDVASGDTITFGGVGCGDTIAFGSNNQCHESVTAAQDAAKAGTWVYAIAYGSSTGTARGVLSPDPNGCSDTENPPISACQTMGGGEAQTPAIQGIASDPSKFYSDPMGGSCTSTDNPTATDIATIFANIASSFIYTQLLPLSML